MSFWARNINGRGRILRIIGGLCMVAGAYLLRRQTIPVWPWVLGIGGAFVLFEGLRGWCVLRACKLKTPF